MKYRNLAILGLIILIASTVIPLGLASPGDNILISSIYQVELFDLKKRGSCDSTKYTITNIDSFPITTSHYFTGKNGLEVLSFNSYIDIGETKTYDLHSMDEVPLYFP